MQGDGLWPPGNGARATARAAGTTSPCVARVRETHRRPTQPSALEIGGPDQQMRFTGRLFGSPLAPQRWQLPLGDNVLGRVAGWLGVKPWFGWRKWRADEGSCWRGQEAQDHF